jgi:hypothetical protein
MPRAFSYLGSPRIELDGVPIYLSIHLLSICRRLPTARTRCSSENHVASGLVHVRNAHEGQCYLNFKTLSKDAGAWATVTLVAASAI